MINNSKIKSLVLVIASIFVFTACSSKNDVEEYNKPALYWYNKMLTQISNGDLDQADDTYTSLESEHRNSPLIATSLLILVNGHIEEEEYALANFYLDEYIKRFALSKNIDYARYLKIKANFLGFTYQLRDQELVENTIKDIADFKVKYQRSPYMPLVDTINARLYMAKASLDASIAELYTKKGKKEAAALYNSKVKESWINPEEIEAVDVPYYRAVFE